MQFSLLGSGSSGNALLITPSAHYVSPPHILVDCGLSLKQLTLRMKTVGAHPADIRSVFITHEHTDHVAGVGVLTRKHGTPIWMTEATRGALPEKVGALTPTRTFESGECVENYGFIVHSFHVTHDAVDPVGYVVESEGAKLGIATDMGCSGALARQKLKGCHALVIEANYCPDMLKKSGYPLKLRMRIRGNRGHLSNPQMTSLLSQLVHPGLEIVVATHVSQENNTSEKVMEAVREGLGGHECRVEIATQDEPTELFEIKGKR